MTIEELVAARAPFDADRPAVLEHGQRQLDGVWKEASHGTWLAWCASRAGVNHRKLVGVLCEAGEWMLAELPSSLELKPALLEPAKNWSRSGEGREEAIASGWECSDRADAAARTGDATLKAAALWALADILLSVRSPLRAPQAIGGCALAVAEVKGTADEAEKALADLMRKRVSWQDLQDGLATPVAKPSSYREEADEKIDSLTERTLQSVDHLLKQAAELQYQFENNLKEVGLSRQAVGRVMEGNFLNDVERKVAQATVQALDEQDFAKPAPRPGGKRPRMTI